MPKNTPEASDIMPPNPTSRSSAIASMAKIAADPQAAAARYGLEFKQCGMCGSPLSHERSRKAGYGHDCAAKHGWAW